MAFRPFGAFKTYRFIYVDSYENLNLHLRILFLNRRFIGNVLSKTHETLNRTNYFINVFCQPEIVQNLTAGEDKFFVKYTYIIRN